MEPSKQSDCRRILRRFWETICPYDIYWGIEMRETNRRHAQWMKFGQRDGAAQAILSQERQLWSTGKVDAASRVEHFKF
jgi:hypothetical protein